MNVTLQSQVIYTSQNIEWNIYFINIVFLPNNNIIKLGIFFGLEKEFYLPKILLIFAANDDEDCFTPAPSICRPPTWCLPFDSMFDPSVASIIEM